ncbi:MAG TPA: NAD(P)H-hydrate dehydratase [Candidatus Baltobacteraceae bacterium]|jgi:NAD(P)H-hydrate epimerase
MIVFDAAGMRAFDTEQVAHRGEVPLMRDAGTAIATLVPRYRRDGSIVGIAGPGNNGGDVFAALAVLPQAFERIIYALPAQRESEARADAVARARASGVEIRAVDSAAKLRGLANAGLILDGLLGVGSHLPLSEPMNKISEAINASGAPVLAIDLPSGVDASTGAVDPIAVRADATVTIGALKLGLLLDPGRELAGDLWLAPIGFPSTYQGVVAHCLSDAEFRAIVPQRAHNTEKREAGAPLVLAGSEQFPGAAVLCARAAARTGAGYVTVAVPQAAAAAVRAHLLEQTIVTYDPSDVGASVETIVDIAQRYGSLAIGPGLGLSDAMGSIMREVIKRVDLPTVIDATGLFHLAKHLDVLYRKRAVLTPHAGEFARLSGKGTVAESDRVSRLRAFVQEHGVTTLLKGRATLVYDGLTLHVNTSGTSALATAGTGDVLTGMIGTLLSQGVEPVDAARAAAYWHGLAGTLAAQNRPIGVVAGDVIEELAAAYGHHSDAIATPPVVRVA